eukprot:305940-Chlamydomonas_euryale.AAC.3
MSSSCARPAHAGAVALAAPPPPQASVSTTSALPPLQASRRAVASASDVADSTTREPEAPAPPAPVRMLTTWLSGRVGGTRSEHPGVGLGLRVSERASRGGCMVGLTGQAEVAAWLKDRPLPTIKRQLDAPHLKANCATVKRHPAAPWSTDS